MFQAEMIQVGSMPVSEYSLYHPHKRLWLEIGEDGGIRFTAEHPVSLSTFYVRAEDGADESDVGTETFAFELLDYMRTSAGTGEVASDDRFIDVTADDLALVGVYRFTGTRPVLAPTGLSFNHDFRSQDVLFEVRGTPAAVDAYIARYSNDYPPVRFGTKFSLQSDGPTKTWRIMRREDDRLMARTA